MAAKIENARPGRAAESNRSGRYEGRQREAFDDGWGTSDEEAPPLRTTVSRDTSRSVIATNNSPDIGFDRSINPYRGCEHGCIYCFARPTHAFLGLSPGLDFESRLFVKPDAPAILERELQRKGYKCQPIAMGTNTDPYQPIERRLEITREILKVLSRYNHPVTIVTKSNLIVRDIDILAGMAERGLAKAAVSVTSLDRRLARRMEPRAATPARRLEAIKALAGAGIPAAVMVAPLIPSLNDPELESILEQAARNGAREAGYILLRLPLELKDLWREWLDRHYPDRASRIMRHIRDARGGQEYDAQYGRRMVGRGPYAELLGRRYHLTCKRLGLNERRLDLDVTKFAVPRDATDQLSLF